jgi:hypothetical protein
MKRARVAKKGEGLPEKEQSIKREIGGVEVEAERDKKGRLNDRRWRLALKTTQSPMTNMSNQQSYIDNLLRFRMSTQVSKRSPIQLE